MTELMQLKTRNKSATEPTYFDYFYIYDFVCLYLDFTFRIDIRECIPIKIICKKHNLFFWVIITLHADIIQV